MTTSGNTVLITGGGTGIGLALAARLVERNNQVIICGRRRERLLAARKCFPQIHTRVCDVSKPASRRALARWITSRFPRLNILVNNAGILRTIDFQKASRDLADADQEIETNLVAPIHLSALLIPHLKRRKAAAIVNISSGLAFAPLAVVPVYSATKAAIHSLSLSLRLQLRATRVRVFEVVPPLVPTELSGRRPRPEGWKNFQSPDEVAQGILQALEKDTYEAALGRTARLHQQREVLFRTINK